MDRALHDRDHETELSHKGIVRVVSRKLRGSRGQNMLKCHELKKGDRVRLIQGAWIGAEGTVEATCMMAAKSKYNPNPRAEQVWVRFDGPSIGFQTDIYDYQLEKIG